MRATEPWGTEGPRWDGLEEEREAERAGPTISLSASCCTPCGPLLHPSSSGQGLCPSSCPTLLYHPSSSSASAIKRVYSYKKDLSQLSLVG